MAPRDYSYVPGDQLADRTLEGNSRPMMWLESEKKTEWKNWLKENPTQHATFEDWKTLKHADGLALYYAALRIWEESDSSDDEVKTAKGETRARVHAPSARESKKALKTNGHGLARSVGSATPSAAVHSEDLTASGKKKRKARKKFLSEEVVASEESEDVGTATPLPTETTPSAPQIQVNGRRKSTNRKPKKKPLSEETVLSADEEDEPMDMNGNVTPAIASPLPVRPAPKAPAAVQTSQSPKKTILKLNTRKAPKKKAEDSVLGNGVDESSAKVAVIPSVTALAAPNVGAAAENTDDWSEHVGNTNGTTASPGPTGETAAQAATRRGLRARRPAQQRPYSIDAETFDVEESDSDAGNIINQPSSSIQSRRVSVASLAQAPTENDPDSEVLCILPNAVHLDPEILAILQGGVHPDPEPQNGHGRPKHYKGKGRAWKKEESDEDTEFAPPKTKAARAKAKAQREQQPPKKRGRPRKSILSEDVIRDDSDEDATPGSVNASPPPVASEVPVKKSRNPPRKSVLSAEIIIDNTDEEGDEEDMFITPAVLPESTTHVPKKRGRPRKSDQSTSSKISVDRKEQPEEAISHTPVEGPSRSHTPIVEPSKSYTPQGDPEPALTDLAVPPAIHITREESDIDSDAVSSPSGIEAHMASVNAEDEDEEEMCKVQICHTYGP